MQTPTEKLCAATSYNTNYATIFCVLTLKCIIWTSKTSEMKKAFYILIFISTFVSTFGQTSCDSVSNEITKKYETYTTKKFEKLKKKRRLDTETMFEIAEFLRHKGAENYKSWYINYIDVSLAEISKRNCDKGNKKYSSCFLFKMGKAYYYTGNLEKAEIFLVKAIVAKCSDKCIDYYLNLITQTKSK